MSRRSLAAMTVYVSEAVLLLSLVELAYRVQDHSISELARFGAARPV